MDGAPDLRCPVCRAWFRATPDCSRCGADLRPLMALCADAWRDRQTARQAIRDGEFGAAFHRARKAQEKHHTPQGRRLSIVAAWLAAYGAEPETGSRQGNAVESP